MTATATPTAATTPLTHRQIMTILSGLMLGMFLASLDQTIVATSIKTIGNDLHDLTAQAWVTTAFLMTFTLSTPIFGKLSDLYGRKRLFMIAIVLFVIASALCGLSTSMYELAGFRALQGIGAGGLFPLAQAIVADIIPPRERARYQGYLTSVFISASVLGPVLGGLFSGAPTVLGITGWRWIFYINVPIAAGALVVVQRTLTLDHVRRKATIDWAGAATLCVALLPLLLVAEQGKGWGWGSGRSLACYLIGVAGVVAFVLAQRRKGADALLPPHLFRNRTFATGALLSSVLGMVLYGGIAATPLWLQIAKGASPTRSGLLLLPQVLGLMGASMISGRVIARTGHYRKLPIAGAAIAAFGLLLFTQLHADTPLWQADICMLFFGVGLGLTMISLMMAMQNSAGPQDIGVASAATNFFRSIGGTLGTAIFLSVLFTRAGTNIQHGYAAAQTDPAYLAAAKAHPDAVATLHSHLGTGLQDTSFLSGLPRALAHPFFVAFSDAADVVFAITAGVAVLAFVIACLMREVPLRTVAGSQARALQAESVA